MQALRARRKTHHVSWRLASFYTGLCLVRVVHGRYEPGEKLGLWPVEVAYGHFAPGGKSACGKPGHVSETCRAFEPGSRYTFVRAFRVRLNRPAAGDVFIRAVRTWRNCTRARSSLRKPGLRSVGIIRNPRLNLPAAGGNCTRVIFWSSLACKNPLFQSPIWSRVKCSPLFIHADISHLRT